MKLRRLIYLPGICVLLISVSLSVFGAYNNMEHKEEVENNLVEIMAINDIRKIKENGDLILYFNEKTAEIAIKQKSTGNLFFSNPVNIENDEQTSSSIKNLLRSQIRVEYITEDNDIVEMSSWEDCISRNQFTFKEIDNGICVSMSIGRTIQQKIYPQVITRENFEKRILNNLDERAKTRILNCYKLYSLKEAVTEKQKDEWLSRFPILSESDVYAIRGFSEKGQATEELSIKIQEELEKYMIEANYTLDMLNEDHSIFGYKADGIKYALFNIDVEYTIINDKFYVRIPVERVKYDTKNFHLTKITTMEYFGAEKAGVDGYIFIPDGSGALINLNDTSNKKVLYTVLPVYGKDYAINQGEKYGSSMHFPIYGIKNGDKGFFAIIESGDAIADITCEVGNIIHSYNTVFPAFNIAYKARNFMDDSNQGEGKAQMINIDNNKYEGDIKIQYSFLSGESADYSGMAQKYREYLTNKGLLKKQSTSDIPFYLEVLGSINKVEKVFGLSKRMDVPLTTYNESAIIINNLLRSNITNIKLRYKGWENGGLNYTAPVKLKTIKKLGGEKQFNELVRFLKNNNVGLFPDVDMMYVYEDKFFDGYSCERDASRMLNKSIAAKYDMRLANTGKDFSTFMYTISPNKFKSYFSKYMNEYNKYVINSISFGSLGNSLNSDFNKRRPVNRQQATEIVINSLVQVAKENEVMVDGGNAYILPYASHILNIPDGNSSFDIYDEVIPFMQMVLHGYLNYAGTPANLSEDYQKCILKAVETGSSIYYTLVYKNIDKLKDTNHNGYYSIEYKNWIEDAIIAYKTVNSVLKEVQNQDIIKHEKLKQGVYMTTYENGTKVIVNYTDCDVNIYDYKIKANDFKVIK